MTRTLAALLLFIVCLSCPGQAETISVGASPWPPYAGPDLPNHGYVSEVARLAFARSGIDIQLYFAPWKRMLRDTRAGRYQAFLPAYSSKQRDKDYVTSAPLHGSPVVLIALKNNDIHYSSLQDLKNYRIGVVRGYVNTEDFDAASYLDKHEYIDDLTCIRLLHKARIDLAVMDMHVARYLAQKHLGNANAIKMLRPMLGYKNIHLLFPKKSPNHQRWAAAFNAGLMSLITDGTLEAIRQKHGLLNKRVDPFIH